MNGDGFMKRSMEMSSSSIGTLLGASSRNRLEDGNIVSLLGAKASLSRRQLEPKENPVTAAKQGSFHVEGDTPLRGDKPVVAAAAPVRQKRHTIFPGAAAIRNGDVPPKPWDESQWID